MDSKMISIQTKADFSQVSAVFDGAALYVAGIDSITDGKGDFFKYFKNADGAITVDDVDVFGAWDFYYPLGVWVRIPSSQKRSEIIAGTTITGGVLTHTYATPYAAIPYVNPVLDLGVNNRVAKVTASTVNGFTITVTDRSDVLGLLPTFANVVGAGLKVKVEQI